MLESFLSFCNNKYICIFIEVLFYRLNLHPIDLISWKTRGFGVVGTVCTYDKVVTVLVTTPELKKQPCIKKLF